MDRRKLFSFLSSSFTTETEEKKVLLIRPPYYKDSNSFNLECPQCDAKCVSACPEKIILMHEDKTPYLDFSSSGCTYCDKCAIACEPNVLNISNKDLINVGIRINEAACLSWQGVMCFSCEDPCLEDAIDFKAMFMPSINQDKCTSCGFCISKCPSLAIDVNLLSH